MKWKIYNTPCKMYNVGAMLLNYTPRTLEEITGGVTCLQLEKR